MPASGLIDTYGKPLTYGRRPSTDITPPKVGVAMGPWAGRDSYYMNLPGGGVMQFDLGKLTLADFRAMRQHYQIGTSLNVLSFVMHQIDWQIQCDRKEIKTFLEDELRDNWTPLMLALSQSFWAGFSPLVVNYENGSDGKIHIKRIKDMVPEESRVKWKVVNGWAPRDKVPPKIYHYDGLYSAGSEVPPENSLWYPLLMENGDYYGRKLLKPAFPPWFFSNLIHLFANRYFERFGEPLPVGRARLDDDVDMGNNTYVSGRDAMAQILQSIRSRAVTVLPSDRDPVTKEYDYDIEYLESQMRGADFERYLGRLDEEMSLSVFTPVLLFRTADVGSYNLGQAHLKMFQQLLNALAGDMQYYIQNYLVDRLRILNFGQSSPPARWIYRRQGQGDVEQYKLLMSELVRLGTATPDLEELGAIVGLTWHEVEQLTEPPVDPKGPVPSGSNEPDTQQGDSSRTTKRVAAAKTIAGEAAARVAAEVAKGKKVVSLGFRNRFATAMGDEFADDFYARLNTVINEMAPLAESGEDMKAMLDRVIDMEFERIS